MSRLVTHPTPTAQWHALVNEAETAVGYQLQEALESYLVFLLMRFASRPGLASGILAIEYLDGLNMGGRMRCNKLKEVGDQCLLYSGLFPKRVERLRLQVSYFVDLGRSAYDALAAAIRHELADVYIDLSNEFVALIDVLQAMRILGADKTALRSLDQLEAGGKTADRRFLVDPHIRWH